MSLRVRVVTRMREVVGLCSNQIFSVIVYLLKTLKHLTHRFSFSLHSGFGFLAEPRKKKRLDNLHILVFEAATITFGDETLASPSGIALLQHSFVNQCGSFTLTAQSFQVQCRIWYVQANVVQIIQDAINSLNKTTFKYWHLSIRKKEKNRKITFFI